MGRCEARKKVEGGRWESEGRDVLAISYLIADDKTARSRMAAGGWRMRMAGVHKVMAVKT